MRALRKSVAAFAAILLFAGLNSAVQAQSVGISAGTITPDASSILEIRSTTLGVLLPRMTTGQRGSISSPATGLIIYNTTTNAFNFYDGSAWQVIPTGTGITSLGGLTGSSQTFVDGTNVTMTSSGTTHTLGWTGQLSIGNGGTGQTTANAAFNALAPSQSGNSGKFLQTDGSTTSWVAGNAGTVTSVDGSGGTTGLTLTGGAITTSGTLTLGGTLDVDNGGTGATTAAGARTNLGAASSGANTDITSVLLDQTGLVVKGASANALTIKPNETLSAARTLNIITGDASRTLTFTGDATISGTNTGDQTNVTGNAATATALQTARTINGVSFDGTANITVTADAGTLTGTTLNSSVVTSSLTSVGTIATGTWNGTAIGVTYGGTGLTSVAQGDLLYGSAANTLSALAKNTSATRYLSNTGGSNNPAWAQIDLTNGVTGVLPLANGGSNANLTAVNGGVVWSDASQMQITAAGTSGQFLKSNGAAAPSWASGRTLITLSIGSDVGSSASTAFQDITGLSFSVTSGVAYRFYAIILYSASATTVGSRWAVNGPASPTSLTCNAQWSATATTNNLTVASAYDTGTSSTTSLATTNNMAIIQGIIIPSASGTFILRFAPETATANGIVVKGGSTLEYW